jgi:hypothetical protein
LEAGNPDLERLNAGLCKLAGTAAILTCIQVQKLPDFQQREARHLRLPDETQTPHVFQTVVPDPAPSRRFPKEVSALVEPDRLHTYATGGGKLADGEHAGYGMLTKGE